MIACRSRGRLAGIDQVIALAAANIDTVPLVAIECKASDSQRLALGGGFLDPVGAAPGKMPAIAHLGDDALQPDLAGVGDHLLAFDLEAFAKLDRGILDQLFQMRLALDQRQFSQILTVEIEQVECDS
jgi:hypothetical protein